METYVEVSCTSVLYQINDDNNNEYNDTSYGSRKKERITERMSGMMQEAKYELDHITNTINKNYIPT